MKPATLFGAALALLPAFTGCMSEGVITGADRPADEEPGDATLRGAPPMAPLPDGQQPTPVSRGTDFDGNSDPELQALLAATGATDFAPVHDGVDPDDVLYQMSSTRSTGGAFEYVGLITPRGHYLVEVDNDEIAIAYAQQLAAEPGASDGRAPVFELDEAELTPYGWSDGVDNRIRRTGGGIPTYVGRVAAAGQCTGALIGSRIVRTAAHCVVASTTTGGTPVTSATFDFRRNAGSTPVSVTTNTIIYGGGYIPAGCGTRTAADQWSGYRANLNTCRWKDWAYLILPSGWNGSTYFTWLGYRKLGTGDLNLQLDHGGYPACGRTDSPASCVNQAFYRDTSANCDVEAFTAGTAKWTSSCDMSPGHSGGAAVSGGQLIGSVQWQDCSTCSSSQTAPNHFIGHDDWLYNYQNTLRATYK